MAEQNQGPPFERPDAFILQNLRQNTAYNILDGAFFGFAIGIASFMTVIPLFVSTLTSSAILIGLIPAIHNMGWQLPQLFIARHVSRQVKFKPMVLRVTLHERIPFLGLAFLAWFSPRLGVQVTLTIAFFLLVWQGLGSGFTASPWQSMIARIFPIDRRGTFYGTQSSAGNLLASIGAVIAGFILGKLASPLDFTLCFTFASGMMVISYIALAQTREPVRPVIPEENVKGTSRQTIRRILKADANFRWFLLVRMISQIAVMGFSFYTVYAVTSLGMGEVTVGILTGVLMGTAIIANPIMGWLADHWSAKAMMAVGMLAAAASGLIAWQATDPRLFFPVFVLAAIANVANWTIPMTLILMFGTEIDRPYYIGMANTFIAPVTVLAPLFGGWLAEIAGYQATFVVSAIVGIATAAMVQIMVRNPKPMIESPASPQRA